MAGSVIKYASRRQGCGGLLGCQTSLRVPSPHSLPCRPRLLSTRCSEPTGRISPAEVDASAAGPSLPEPLGNDSRPMMSSVQTYKPGDDRLFQVLLAVITKLWSSPDQLERFIQSRPEPTSMPFLMWLADQEAQSSGQQQLLLAALCEQLVVRRERFDRERMEQLYLDTLDLLTSDPPPGPGTALPLPNDASQPRISPQKLLEPGCSGNDGEAVQTAGQNMAGGSDGGSGMHVDTPTSSTQSEEECLVASDSAEEGQGEGRLQQAMQLQGQRREKEIALLSSSPDLYAAMLAEKLTGVPAVVDGFGTVYDLLLKAAPPAALTEQGIKKAHADAEELALDMRQRRKRSVAAIIGRAKLTAEQADRLKAGSPASRILDMLLTAVPTNEERVACLGDCFTPPVQNSEEQHEEQTTEELWCSPAQLLSEVEVRIRGMSAGGGSDGTASRLLAAQAQISGPELMDSLKQLRAAIMVHLLNSMP